MAALAGPADPPECPVPLPPSRRRDVVELEGLAELVDEDAPGRALIKSRDIPELDGLEFQPSNIQVVLFDMNSLDSFAACFAAYELLGDSAVYEGVTRQTCHEPSTDVMGKVVAMVGVSCNSEDFRDFLDDCDWLFILETHDSAIRELETLPYEKCTVILDRDMGSGALAWNFFHPGQPVPPFLRALEDAELGRDALRSSRLFADGLEALRELGGEAAQQHDDEDRRFEAAFGVLRELQASFREMGELIVSELAFEEFRIHVNNGPRSIAYAAKMGEEFSAALEELFYEASARRTVQTLRRRPAWRCAVCNLATPFAGRVAEHLARQLGGESWARAAEQSFAAVFEVRGRRVHVQLRSLPGGPDVSQVVGDIVEAYHADGKGRRHQASFEVFLDQWEDLWVPPEPVLWDTRAAGASALALQPGKAVTVVQKSERFKEAPCNTWSWGYCSDDHTSEGWIPTNAHTMLVATRGAESEGPEVLAVKEGDVLVAHGQKGRYYYGTIHAAAGGFQQGWFPSHDGLWRPLDTTRAWAAVRSGVLGKR